MNPPFPGTPTGLPPTECWPWQGRYHKTTPILTGGGRARAAIWTHHTGQQPPTGWAVRSRCRNASCVNPAHLYCSPPSAAEKNRRNTGDLPANSAAPDRMLERARRVAAETGQPLPADLTVGAVAAWLVSTELAAWGWAYQTDPA